MDDISNC